MIRLSALLSFSLFFIGISVFSKYIYYKPSNFYYITLLLMIVFFQFLAEWLLSLIHKEEARIPALIGVIGVGVVLSVTVTILLNT
ncbi:hypothetical protein [Priestia koreensis]|uniref:Uncharacterized protein n=1 Tax=Priestia koreensis TaxID=284581 RepID=A0A0M0L6B7_9BACI|nr:hypothetical protein [Priestia koreensis]KOO46218.1 hypothetical protein AMD01_10165 [Priestia koreensis]MCM3004274.1 hypothetical protein [Priestia koreensis]UNL83486.1 hypothetical protein IE339_15090 [Priestia koreensis]